MDRLTARRADNGLAYLVGVKPNEQEVDSPHPNTLKCILECFQRLAEYEDTGLTPGNITYQTAQLQEWQRKCNRRPDMWIPVTERLPDEGDTVLMWHKDGFVMLAVNMFDEMDNVTHWMPLPSPPKEGRASE